MFLAWMRVRPRRVGVEAAAASADVIAVLAGVHFCVRQTQHLFSWTIERLQFTERAVGGVPDAAMSDTVVFPGRPPAGSRMICGYAGTSGLYGWPIQTAALCLRRLPGHSPSVSPWLHGEGRRRSGSFPHVRRLEVFWFHTLGRLMRVRFGGADEDTTFIYLSVHFMQTLISPVLTRTRYHQTKSSRKWSV